MWSSSPVLPCCCSLVCTWTAVGHICFPCCLHKWASLQYMLSHLVFKTIVAGIESVVACAYVMTTTSCHHQSWKWKSFLSVYCPRAALMRVLYLGRWHCCLAVFLWLQVWWACQLFHFLEDHSGRLVIPTCKKTETIYSISITIRVVIEMTVDWHSDTDSGCVFLVFQP